MKRRILALMLTGTLVLGQAPAVFAAEEYNAAEEIIVEEAEELPDEELIAEAVTEEEDPEAYTEEYVEEYAEESLAEEVLEEEPPVASEEDSDLTEITEGTEEELPEDDVQEEASDLVGVPETLSLEISKTSALINEDVVITLTASNPAGIHGLRLWDGQEGDGSGDWRYDWQEPDDFDHRGLLHSGFSWGEEGHYDVYAEITYDDVEDPDDAQWIRSNAVSIDIGKLGEIGDFTVTTDKETVTRGDTLQVTFSEAEHADSYWLDVYTWDEEREEREWYDTAADTDQAGTVSLNTMFLEPGSYRLMGQACGTGYEGKDSGKYVKLTVLPPDVEEGQIKIEVDKTSVETQEEFTVSVLAPGAERIEVSTNYDQNVPEDQTDWNFDEDDEYCIGTDSYGSSGTYAIAARVHYPDGTTRLSQVKTMTVTAPNGRLSAAFPDSLPLYLEKGSGLSFTVEKPEHASEYQLDAWWDTDDEQMDGSLFYDETKNDSMPVYISPEAIGQIPEGRAVNLNLSAWGRGYEQSEVRTSVPVLAPDQASVTFSLADSRVMVNETTTATIQVPADKVQDIKDVVIRNDEEGDWWHHPDEFDRSGVLTDDGFSCSQAGRHVLYAQITYDDWNGEGEDTRSWISSNPVAVMVESKGDVGAFSVSVNKTQIKQGDNLVVTFTDSANADHYWIDVEKGESMHDTEWYDSHIHAEKAGSYNLSTLFMTPGTYWLTGKASGLGYSSIRGAGSPIKVVVTDSGLKKGDVRLAVDKTEAVTFENVVGTVYAPGASWIELFPDYPDNEGWRHDGGGESLVCENGYSRTGTFTVKAFAHYEGDVVRESNPVQITVTAPKGDMAKPVFGDIKAFIDPSQDFSFTVTRPENADSMWLGAWTNEQEGREILHINNLRAGTSSVQIDKETLSGLKIGTGLKIEAVAGGTGYEESAAETQVTVFRADPDVVVTTGETKIYASTETAFKVECHDHTTPVEKLKIWEGGYGYWGGPDHEYVPDDDEHVVFSEDNKSVSVEIWFDDTGSHTLFVQALFEGDPNWYTSEVFTYEVTSIGEIGNFHVSASPSTLLAGEELAVTYSKAENAVHYWSNLQRYDERDREWRWFAGNLLYSDQPGTVMLNNEALYDRELEPGRYLLEAFANAEGYAAKRADQEVYFEVISKEEADLRKDAEACRAEIEGLTAKSTDAAIAAAEKHLNSLTDAQREYLGGDAAVRALEKKLQDVKAAKKAAEKKKTTIKASATTAKKGKKTVIKLTADSGAKLTVTGTNANAKNKKFVKIKNGKTAKLTFTKKAKKGKYTFKVTCPANGTYLAATKTIKIRVK